MQLSQTFTTNLATHSDNPNDTRIPARSSRQCCVPPAHPDPGGDKLWPSCQAPQKLSDTREAEEGSTNEPFSLQHGLGPLHNANMHSNPNIGRLILHRYTSNTRFLVLILGAWPGTALQNTPIN